MKFQQTIKALKFCMYLLSTILISCNNNSTADKKYNELSEKDYEHKVDTVDGEEVYFKSAVSASIPQDFTNLDTAQKFFIKHSLQGADTLIKANLAKELQLPTHSKQSLGGHKSPWTWSYKTFRNLFFQLQISYANLFRYSLGVTPNIFFTYLVKNDRLENSILSAISAMFRCLFFSSSIILSLA
jgi:hypothetical protein